MVFLKRLIITFVLIDNFLTQFLKNYVLKPRYKLTGKCKMCGVCCQEILLKATPRQMSSKLFLNVAIWWISWLFDFILLRVDYEYGYLVWTCKHKRPDGKCGNYFWRPNVCRNYPLVDYFDEPKTLPDCGFKTNQRQFDKLSI